MDPLSITTGIIALIDVSGRILLSCYRLREQIKGFESDIAAIIEEIQSLSDISEELKDIFEQCQEDDKLGEVQLPNKRGQLGGSALEASQSALNACVDTLNELAEQLEPLSKPRLRNKLRWPFESATINQKLDIIQKQKATLQLALSVYQTRLLQNQSCQIDHFQHQGKEDKVLRWYKTSDPERNHRLAKDKHEPNTGSWVFEDEKFQHWKETTGELLWLHGIPGAGKTVLCSTIIEHMLKYSSTSDHASGLRHQVVYFYFDFSDSSKQNLVSLLKSVIFQLGSTAQGPSTAAESLFETQKRGLNEPSLEELVDVCVAEVVRTQSTYLLIDALDESPMSERGPFFQKFLQSMLQANVSILITSRKEPDIERGLKDVASDIISLQASVVDEDVRTHVHTVIHTDPTLSSVKPALQKEILDEIVAGARGMFRWAICQLDRIKQCLTPAMIREELKVMPETLDETYDRILFSVPSAHQAFVQSALHWLAFSARPLLLEELAEAAVIKPETGQFDPESSRLLKHTMIIDLCGVLVSSVSQNARENRMKWLDAKGEVETRGIQNFTNKTEITVLSLSHYSVKEYIISTRLRSGPLSCYHTSTRLANSFLGQCCLLYIKDFNGGRVASQLDFEEYPLLEYASRSWMQHWARAGGESCDATLRQSCEGFFHPNARNSYMNWLNVWNPDNEAEDRLHSRNYGLIKMSADLFQQPLYWAAFLGDLALVELLVDQGADITAREGYFESAFGVAAFRGHLEVVEFLLGHGLSPNLQGTTFGSILQIAVAGGHLPVVRRLLEAGADVNAQGGVMWDCALTAAVSKQFTDIVTLLLENGAELNPDMQPEGSTLFRAAKAGDIQLATILLGAGADANGSSSGKELSPLYAAVQAGSLPLVRLLIRHGADVNKSGEHAEASYRHALTEAANRGHSHIVQALLQAGADPNSPDEPALDEAIGSRDMTTFRLILDAGADVNRSSNMYENCFHKAVSWREFDMARILMDKGAELGDQVLIAAVNKYKRQPWILETLLARGVNVDVFAEYSGTPTTTALHVAVMKWKGDDTPVELLLEKGAYVNAIDQRHYTTPLCLAIQDGKEKLARLLIAHGADIKRKINYSPFEMAIKWACDDGGSLEMADMLLRSGVDINIDTEAAPFWPLKSDKPDVLRYLSDKGIDLNRVLMPKDRPSGGRTHGVARCTPVQFTAERGNVEMLQLLLDLGADLDRLPGPDGTTLQYGLLSKNKEMVDFLLEKQAKVDDDSVADQSAICKAITWNMPELVPRLLDSGANVNANEQGESPLAVAYIDGHQDLVELLRKHGARFSKHDAQVAIDAIEKEELIDLKWLLEHGLDPNAKNYSRSAIESAMCKTDTAAIELLIEKGANLSGEECQYALIKACKTGHIEMATVVLNSGQDFDLDQALREAVYSPNNTAMMKMLVERGADIAACEGQCFDNAARSGCQNVLTYLLQQPMTLSQRHEYLGRALQAAASDTNLNLCKWLLDVQGADINHHGLPCGSPLQAVIASLRYRNNNQLVLFKMLLAYGADVNPPLTEKPKRPPPRRKIPGFKTDESTSIASPLTLAIGGSMWRGGLQAVVPQLLSLGADVNGLGGSHHTPLQAAALRQPSILAELLDRGADVNAVGGIFGTALHAAAWNKDIESAKLLLARGADISISAGKYGSVMQAAAKGNRFDRQNGRRTVEMMDLLLQNGADIHARDGKYGSAVQLAAVSGNVAALDWLAAHGADIRVKGGRRGNAYRAALKNLHSNKSVEWPAVSWLEQHYGRDGWD
ncbi:ankyrin repeat-containing domain protein [Thelonectria olida]|uniref:Ankyrin repeat-containing domain protein n=1 Tax=Thelonectria olida TaxID=1576542 RepID=A0A9P8W0A4_9HYPO|nr:ankyrin repeat-containing domain protein [Thelonectria olida]